jgi:outer membrane protein assembly factor BamB
VCSYTTGDFVQSSPAVANGVVYVGSLDHNLYALNAKTGSKLWSYTTGGIVYSSPAVANGVVYVGSGDSKVYAFGLK